MNRRITIRNIGPIKVATIQLNTINVFMGPQSSGKSTIAKLLSFCMWVDKEVTLHQDIEFVDEVFLDKELFDFHKVRAYFNPNSYFKYDSDILSLEYDNGKIQAQVKDGLKKAEVGKVAYIPAERIIVSLPEIRQTDLQYHNVRSFIFDWFKIREKYNSTNPVIFNELNQKYYFDESTGRDVMVLENGKEIPFSESSSGIQSYVPLSISLKYLTDWIYHNQEDISYEKKDLINKVVTREFLNANNIEDIRGGKFSESSFKAVQNDEHIKSITQSLTVYLSKEGKIDNPKDEFESSLSMAQDLKRRINSAHFSDIVIEEPELNLFPDTQSRVVNEIFRIAENERDSFILTSHSPYILFAINNCMMGGLVSDKVPSDILESFSSKDSWINPKKVSIYEIHDGLLTSPQDEDGTLKNNYLNKAYQESAKEYLSLLEYYDQDTQE